MVPGAREGPQYLHMIAPMRKGAYRKYDIIEKRRHKHWTSVFIEISLRRNF
jgi:hypothetical protein